MRFHDLTIVAGAIRSSRYHDSTTLGREAVAFMAGLLSRCGADFRAPVLDDYELMFTDPGEGVAAATFLSENRPATTSYLLTGKEARADRDAMRLFQQLIIRMNHPFGVEPSWDVQSVTERPVLLTLILPSASLLEQEVIQMIADMETCLAAAYFQKEFPT